MRAARQIIHIGLNKMAINYIEKGIGLGLTIASSGHWVRQNNQIWECSDEQAVQAIIDAYPISATIAEKKLEIDEYAKELRIKAAGGMSPEQSSWAIKSAQAQKYAATSNPADASLLAAEAAYRGDTLQSVVDRVLANAGGLLEMEARIAGVAGKHKDSVTAMLIDNPTADDFRAVLDYDYKSDAEWPSL
jgi:hypothetical protein